MKYTKVDCPSCGNSTTARSEEGIQKCSFCRRMFEIKFKKLSRNRIVLIASAVPFPSEVQITAANR